MARLTKEFFDRSLALFGLIIFSPIIAIVALVVYFGIGSPILFNQPRPGLHGRVFMFHKFRTMTNACDTDGNLLPDAQRLTALGRFLRKTSLDELPQLWNVVKGDMSLVGPRPLLVQYLDRYTPEQARRHEVKPGITGWAQVNGRNSISWTDKFKLDVWYVDRWNLMLDLKILILTIVKVIKRDGISEQNQATMTQFLGNSSSLE